jgi:hypothetical protein
MHSKIYRFGLVAVALVGMVGLIGCGQSKVGSEAELSALPGASSKGKVADLALTLTCLPAENPKLVTFQDTPPSYGRLAQRTKSNNPSVNYCGVTAVISL